MNGKRNFILAGVAAFLTVILVCLVRFVDVAAIGPEGTSIGLSRLNGAAFEAFGVSMTWYKLTTVLGIAAILTAGLFALLGLFQLIRRKSLKKVDREILVLAGLYVVTIVLYFLLLRVSFRAPDDRHGKVEFDYIRSEYGNRWGKITFAVKY